MASSRPPRSLADGVGTDTVTGGALLKLGAEAAALVLSFATGAMTARNLGPQGKGDLATMGYVMVLLAAGAGLGLGEAGVTAFGRGRSLREIVDATTAAVMASSAATVLVFLGVAALLFRTDWPDLVSAILLTAGAVPAAAGMLVLSSLLDARRDFPASAAARILSAAVTALATFGLVIVLRTGIAGAALAALLGWTAGAVIVLVRHRSLGTLTRPRLDRTYLGPALRLGVPIQVSYLLMAASTRLDVVVVHTMAGSQEAGRYSVAVTLGSLAAFTSVSLAAAAYPATAAVREDDVPAYIARLVRAAFVASVVTAAVLTAVLPFLIPAAFGPGFRASVAPAIIIAVGGPFWSCQWVACRAKAAAGDSRPLLRSYSASLLTMLAADVALVPSMGATGAAVAASMSSVLGAAVAIASLGRHLPATSLVPRASDLRDFADVMAKLLRRGGRAAPPPSS